MNSKHWKAVMMNRGAVRSFPTCKLDRPLSAQREEQSRTKERSGQYQNSTQPKSSKDQSQQQTHKSQKPPHFPEFGDVAQLGDHHKTPRLKPLPNSEV